MITLYDNPFSPFTRKVRMVLWLKGLPFESIDALAHHESRALARVNPRMEVPVLVEDGFVVVDSADIVYYLEDRHPDPPVFPEMPERRAEARHWQRIADTVLDAVIHDISLWVWPTHERKDEPPPGLIAAGRRDILRILSEMEESIDEGPFLCGPTSIADIALFPHVSSLKALGIVLEEGKLPRVRAWVRAMRSLPFVQQDLEHVRRSALEKFGAGRSPYEDTRVVWRGDRLEWLLRNGFHEWWLSELEAGRVIVPGSVDGGG